MFAKIVDVFCVLAIAVIGSFGPKQLMGATEAPVAFNVKLKLELL